MAKFSRRFFANFFLLAIPISIGIVLTLLLLYKSWFAHQSQQIEDDQAQTIERVIALINREFGHFRNVARFVKNSLAVQQALSLSDPVNDDILTKQFVHFGYASELFSQLRWLDGSGQEIVRVNVRDGESQVVAKNQLQDKHDRYYFKDSLPLKPNQVYISPIDLNIENHRIVVPFEPTVRVTMRTGDGKDGLHSGVLVFNFELTDIFDRVRRLSNERTRLQILNSQGFWLVSPDSATEWGWQIGHPSQNLGALQPSLWHKLQRSPHQVGLLADGELLSYSTVNIDTRPDRYEYVYVVASTLNQQIDALRYQAIWPLSIIGFFGLVFTFYGCYRYARATEENFLLSERLAEEKQTLEQMNRYLQQSKLKLEKLQNRLVESKKLSSLGMIISGVAHELNTPAGGALVTISSMQGQLMRFKTALRSGITRGQITQFIQTLDEGMTISIRNLEQQATLIEKFKHAGAEVDEYKVEKFHLRELLEILVQTLNSASGFTQIHFEVAVEPTDLELETYPKLLSQVLKNLIENAWIHGYSGEDSGDIVINASVQQQQLLLEIIDHGHGIADPEIAKRLFDPFITTGRGSGHTGLGLYFVYQWVTLILNGTIDFSSINGKGTTFILTIPLTLSEPELFE